MTGLQRVDAVDLTRVWGRRFALRNATFSLGTGSVTALIGGNGAGKSTTFNLLAQRLAPTRGHVLFDGQPAGRSQAERRMCGYLSHKSFLYSDLTAVENLALTAGLYRLEASEPAPLLKRVGLARHGDRLVREYSRGMVQRLALARLLLVDPCLWLLDEPATGLDQSGRSWLVEELASLREEGKIIALSSHSRPFLRSVATHAVVLKRGLVVASGAVESPEAVDALFEEHVV